MDDRVLIDLLVQVAACEEEMAEASHTVAHHTDREQHLRELQAEYEEDAALAADGDQGVAVRLRAKESEIRAVNAELDLKRDRTVGVSDRRQYQALQAEIATLEQKLAGLENEAVMLLEKSENAATGATVAAAEAEAQAEKGGREQEQLASESEAAGRSLVRSEDELKRLVAMLPPAVRRHVERLHQGGRRAVVRVQGEACGGCFGQLPAQQAIDADKGRAVVRCAGCAAYVVHHPWQ